MRVLVLLALFCGVAGETRAVEATWKSRILWEGEHGLGGATIGDSDPDAPGNEIVGVNSVGEVWMVRRSGTTWNPRRIYRADGELIMGAIGDVDSRFGGNEFVGVGVVGGDESSSSPGQVVVIHRERDEWVGSSIVTDDRMIHGVAIGDVSRHHKGHEIVVCGFNHRVHLLHIEEGSWKSEAIYVGDDRMKVAVVADVFPERGGEEVLVCRSDGEVFAL